MWRKMIVSKKSAEPPKNLYSIISILFHLLMPLPPQCFRWSGLQCTLHTPPHIHISPLFCSRTNDKGSFFDVPLSFIQQCRMEAHTFPFSPAVFSFTSILVSFTSFFHSFYSLSALCEWDEKGSLWRREKIAEKGEKNKETLAVHCTVGVVLC